MNRLNIYLLILIIFPLIYSNCNYSSDLGDMDVNEVSTEPKSFEFKLNPNSYQIESFPTYSIEYTQLLINGVLLHSVKYYYPSSRYDIEVKREFLLSANDSFAIEFKNCNKKYNWYIDYGKTTEWENNDIFLSNTIKTINADSSINYKFIFKALRKSKGYISFIEVDQNGSAGSDFSHGLVIGYTINPINNLRLDISEIKWIYEAEQNSFSRVTVQVKGNTNAFRLRGLTTGDGIRNAIEIPLKSDQQFEIKIPVAFSHIPGMYLKNNSELLVYGTIGLPKVITLVNPAGTQ